jgi:hypothetical protein
MRDAFVLDPHSVVFNRFFAFAEGHSTVEAVRIHAIATRSRSDGEVLATRSRELR